MQPNTTQRCGNGYAPLCSGCPGPSAALWFSFDTDFEAGEDGELGALSPVVRAPDCANFQDYPTRVAEAHAWERARELAKHFGIVAPRAPTDDGKARLPSNGLCRPNQLCRRANRSSHGARQRPMSCQLSPQ